MGSGKFSPKGSKTREQFERDDIAGRRHDYEDHWAPTSAHAPSKGIHRRGGGLPSQTNNPAFGYWSGDDAPPRRANWTFYANSGGIRPAWEDVVLSIVDMRNWKERREHDESERRREADEIRSVGLINRRRATKEARALAARHRRRARQREVSSWHAPRTEAGYPEGYQPEETTEEET